MSRLEFGKNKGIHSHYTLSKPITKWDVFLIAAVVIAIIICLAFILSAHSGTTAEVYYHGELIATYDISHNKTFTLDVAGQPTLTIKDNKIAITHNSCKNQLCVHTGFIGNINERIICAPNKLTIIIKGKNSEFDATTGGR